MFFGNWIEKEDDRKMVVLLRIIVVQG